MHMAARAARDEASKAKQAAQKARQAAKKTNEVAQAAKMRATRYKNILAPRNPKPSTASSNTVLSRPMRYAGLVLSAPRDDDEDLSWLIKRVSQSPVSRLHSVQSRKWLYR